MFLDDCLFLVFRSLCGCKWLLLPIIAVICGIYYANIGQTIQKTNKNPKKMIFFLKFTLYTSRSLLFDGYF